MASQNLLHFLIALSKHVDLQRSFRNAETKERLMTEAGLSEDEKELIRKNDVEGIKAALGDDISAPYLIRLDF